MAFAKVVSVRTIKGRSIDPSPPPVFNMKPEPQFVVVWVVPQAAKLNHTKLNHTNKGQSRQVRQQRGQGEQRVKDNHKVTRLNHTHKDNNVTTKLTAIYSTKPH
jgi:hypothetical protein